MRMSRRMGLNSIVRFKIPTDTGTYVLSVDKKKGQMIRKTSGTLTLPTKGLFDLFGVGGGAGGVSGTRGGAGGGSGRTITKLAAQLAAGAYTAVSYTHLIPVTTGRRHAHVNTLPQKQDCSRMALP